MSTGSYRKDYEAQLAARAALLRAEGSETRTSVTMGAEHSISSPSDGIAAKIEAMQAIGPDATATPSALTIEQVIERLADDHEDVRVRRAALVKLKELEFFGPLLDPYRPAYLEALKKAARSKVADLALAALEALAVHKEPFAREMLLGFIKAPRSSVIPVAQALQLLSYDDHSEVTATARGLLEKSKDPQVAAEAIRLLSSDPGSADLFSTLLGDKSQPRDVRRLSANGLHNVAPQQFGTVARKIVDDEDEDDDLRAACLSTLTHFSDYVDQRRNKTFAKRVRQLGERARSVNLKATASRYLERLKQEQK
jgi:hypothetical protein